MGKKRKSSVAEGDSVMEGKKAKSMEVEFTGTHLKTLLKEPQTALKGLEQFINLARKLPSPDLYDVVEGYIKISVECVEIVKLLEGEKRPESEMMLIFQALEAILLRTASDLSHLNLAGANIVKKMLNTHMKLIYASVYSETHRMSRICLNLLSAMVTQGPDCAREVFSHFDFHNKFLPTLLKRRDKQGRPDVRMAYIQFAMSFLISGDNPTIIQIIELNDFVGEIFTTGIKEDRISTVNLLLSLLKTKVVHNKAITKTQKVRFFTFTLLNHVASLYRWNGIVDVSTEDIKDIKDPKEAAKFMIRELVHNFLKDLCCSLKHGINFYDPSLGTAGRAGNLVLLRFLVALKTATEDELIGDLVVNILKVCPDLLSRYFKETQYSFVPRVKTAWLDNIKLLKKIYEAQPVISPAFRTTEFVPLPRLLSMLMITTVAPVCNKAMFTQGLNLPNKIVKHTILSLVCSILRRAELNISHCLREDIWQKSEIYTPATMSEFAQKYREALSKLLPDINTVVATWQSLSKGEGTETEGASGNSTTPEEELPPAFQELPGTQEEHGLEDVQTTLLKASLLQVVCLYQKVVPHLVAQSNFDFSKLLKGIVTEKGVREEVPPVLQSQILQVALVLPANKFSWFKVQETPDASGEKSVFYLLLKMFATCVKPQLKNSTRLLIIKVLRDSGVFEYTWNELDLWLRNLDKVTEDSKEAVIQFLEQVLVKLVSNPYPYTDKAAESVQEASMLQNSLSKQDSDTVSIPISHIDDVMDMVDVIVEGSEGLDDEIGVTLDNDLILQTFPFSAAVPVALEIRSRLLSTEESENGCVQQYLVSVLTDILHSQRDPLALCLLLQNYDKELKSLGTCSSHYSLLGSFHKYYSLWIPSPSKEALFQGHSSPQTDICLQDDGAYSSLLKKTFVSSCAPEDNTEELLKEAVGSLTIEQIPVTVKHTLLCLRSTMDNFSQFKKPIGASRLGLFLDLLNCLLCRANTVRVINQGVAEESQKESELFIDTDSTSVLESSVNMVLEDILTVIFRHPSLENWFLALERQSVPPHSLNPVGVKQLSSHLNQGVTQLLKSSAPLLQEIGSLHLVSKYFEAISESILKELNLLSKTTNKNSQALEALESLYLYMDTAELNEIILAILKLPEELLLVQNVQDETGKQLSFYGKVLLQLLTACHQRKQPEQNLASVVAHVRGVSNLLPSSDEEELEAVLYDSLQAHTEFAHVVGVEILTYCLNKVSEISLCIAALLIQHSTTHLLHFEVWCLNPGKEKHLRKNSEAYLPLINGYMKSRGRFHFARPSKISSAVLRVLKEAFWSKLLTVALSSDTVEGADEQINVLSKLMETADISDLQKCIDQLPEILAQSYSQAKWDLADAVTQAAETAGVEISSWMRALMAACMKCLTATYSANKECEKAKEEAEKAMLLHFKKLLPFVREDVPAEWNGFVKTGLKHRYKDWEFLDALNAAIGQWYESDIPSSQGLVPLPTVHMMLTQHSLFLPTLLSSQQEGSATSHLQEVLVDILKTIVKKCPSVCDGNHFAILLGAYGATLSNTDQKILRLLQAYEMNNHSLTEFRLLLWGPAAVEHHKTRKTLGKSLWQQPSMDEILSLLDREKMMETILHFPQHRKLIAEGEKEHLYEDSGIKELDKLYDPCFLLPLFSELVRPELVVDCVKFVDANALGLTIVALSSYDYNMRAAANYVLGSFLSHMEGARFRDKRQLQYLMDIVKNGIRQPNQRLTFLLPLYVAKASQQILKPEEHIYIKMSKFLLSHQYLDMKKVPDFYKLFYSFDFEHKLEREWILELLRDGIRDKYCYELCDNQRIFHVIMAYYNSPLSDEISQNLVLEILKNASHVTKAAYQLIRDHSLLTWIIHILEKRYLENKLLENLISLLHNLWLTNLGKRVSSMASGAQDKDELAKEQKLLPLHLVSEFVSVLVAMIRHIRSNLDFIHITQFFSTLSSVLRYRSMVLDAFKEMGRFAVNALLFSSLDALLILHKWSTIEKDLDLQESLSSLAQKHKIKELLSTIKEKYKPQVPHKLRKQVEAGVQSHEEAPQELSVVKATRNHVKSVLIHWEPVFLTLSLRLEKEQGEAATDQCETQDKSSDTDSFESAAACLIAKWILRTESGDSPTPENIYTSLQWFQTSILPHGPVVEELLEDRVLRSSLYKLYSTVCSDMKPTTSSPDLLPLFNTVMVQLTKTQKSTANLCLDALKAVSLSSNEEDSVQKAVCNFLTSLYIQDIWLGADDLDMFRSHVKAVCQAVDLEFPTAKEKTPKRKKKETQETIVSFCKDLSKTLL